MQPGLIRRGAMTGALAGLVTGLVDAVWSWGAAAQFAPGFLTRLRFCLFSATLHALAGFVVGLLLACFVVTLGYTRLGDLVRFAWRTHLEKRADDPKSVLAGLALAIAKPVALGACFLIAFKFCVPFLTNRHSVPLEVGVAMGAAVGAIAVAIPIAFVLAVPIEWLLRKPSWRPLASPFAPFVAVAVIAAIAIAVVVKLNWETAKLLPLRAPAVAAFALLMVAACYRPAAWLVVLDELLVRKVRIAVWIAFPVLMFAIVLGLGASHGAMRATTAFTGLGGPISHALRTALDFDRDGYSSFLGGGDCAPFDRSVHPGATDVPDDGIDQNCVGGDATSKRDPIDTHFVPPPAAAKDANILLITIDTTRADHLHMYGYARETTPELDKLAKDGTVFEQGWAHAPSTRYSMPAIMTGRLPLEVHYGPGWWPSLAPEATTIAERLQPLGFHTGAITNYEYFDRSKHFDQGFAEYDNENARLHVNVGGPDNSHGSSSQQQTDKALAFVARHQNEKWMLWVHYYDPHYAYEPHAEKSFGSDDQALYDGEIWFTDHHIGRLLDDLRAKGLYDKTIVVVTGDHGEGFGEHPIQPDGGQKHGYHLYTEDTKVPLLVKVPGMAPRRTKTPGSHIDIMPTLVDLAGGQTDSDMMGRSLVDVIGGADLPRTIIQELSYENNNEQRGAVDGTCHVIYNVSPDTSWEAYRIADDPDETVDVSGDACEDTRNALGHWFDESKLPADSNVGLIARPPGAAIGDFGKFAHVLSVTGPATAKVNQPIELTWTLEVVAKPPDGWRIYVHAEGPSFVNADHDPVRPIAIWKPGDVIRYTKPITVNTPGHYAVNAGMFKGADNTPAAKVFEFEATP